MFQGKRVYLSRAVALCYAAILAALVGGDVWAAEVDGLYDARVPVTGQEEGERVDAARAAFAEVLVKVTGNRNILTDPQLATALLQPMGYVQQFFYRAYPAATNGAIPGSVGAPGTSPFTQLLWISFDPEAVNRLLLGAGIPVWGRLRPNVLLWLAVEDFGGRYIVAADSEDGFSRLIRQEANRRGIPIIFPLMDLEDQMRLGFADIWGNFQGAIIGASQRYQTETVLVGRMFRSAAGDWQVRWTLYQGDDMQHWVSEGGEAASIFMAGVDDVADRLGAKYAQFYAKDQAESVTIAVSDIFSVEDYALATGYLSGLDLVENVRVAEVYGDQVTYTVAVRGQRQALVKTIGFGGTLVPVKDRVPDSGVSAGPADRQFGAPLAYRLLR